MQRHRFHATPSHIDAATIHLDADEAHHLARALRLGPGDRVFVFDGLGHEWECEVAQAGKRDAELRILHRLENIVEAPLAITLAQALVKGDKFDWIVQKTTELGVARIVPLVTDHSDVRLNKGRGEERVEQKLQRWRRIALEAVKQCGRRHLVEIAEPVDFAAFCEAETASWILSERGGRSLRDAADAPPLHADRITLCIGSEGGWSDAELTAAESHGLTPVSLGPRILRTETAAVAAVALAQHLLGDLR
ncbi:MAG: 16S rRNA (uracil(1498)-N(3))-methyltransferase [Blastocatellia bacterium]|nr:16S rRNA (uracil(1498)-N(3))-methyltransferase [Blastocatellia bacterium]